LIPFVEWMDDPEHGFFVREVWSDEESKWIGPGKMRLRDFQRRIFNHLFTLNDQGKFPYETILYSTVKKSGKALALDTKIPTPTGWTTMGELKVGDEIFGSSGKPTKVTFVTDVMENRKCYKMKFSSGDEIIADAEHQWSVSRRGGHSYAWKSDIVMTTEQMIPDLVVQDYINSKGYHTLNRRYKLTESHGIDLPDVDLPVSPYAFGCWLGDGDSRGGRLTIDELDEEITERIMAEGDLIQKHPQKNRTTAYSISDGTKGGSLEKKSRTFGGRLRHLGVIHNKHIPVQYLRASVAQRYALLQGLMDTDGYVSIKGRCEFTSTNINIANGVSELLASLGIKNNIIVGEAKLNGRYISPKYRIHFQAYKTNPVFHLKRKYDRLKDAPTKSSKCNRVMIESIEEVESVPVRCIQVAAWDELYLIGTGFIPTHNTAIAAAIEAWYAEQLPPDSYLYCIANDEEQAEGLVMGDIRYHAKEAGYRTLKGMVEYPNGTTIRSLAQSFKSVAGARHAMTVFDELWGYTSEASRRAWDEMTPIPTVPNSLRVIATYAGFENESDLLWDLYLQGVGTDEHEKGLGKPIPELEDLPCWSNGGLFTYWDHEPRMPWQDETYYSNQRKSLRPSAYLRLHTNSWTSSNEEFLPIEWWDRACKAFEKPADQDPKHPFRGGQVIISVDAAPKRDCTAISGWTHDSIRGKTIMLFNRIWTPEKGKDFDLEATVEAYILEKSRKFNIVSIVYDPRDLHQTMTRLRSRGLPCNEYVQQQENMVRCSQALYDALKFDNIEAYPDEEWRKHIQMATAENSTRGFRIVKEKGNRKSHVDGAISTAMGVYDAIHRSEIYSGDEIRVHSPFADTSTWDKPNNGPKLPWEFME